MFLFLSSIVIYSLVNLGYQLESFGYAFVSGDPRVLGCVSIVILVSFLLFFLLLMKDKEYEWSPHEGFISTCSLVMSVMQLKKFFIANTGVIVLVITNVNAATNLGNN